MFCDKCGREIRDDSVYCSYCGVRVEDQGQDEPEGGRSHGHEENAPCIRPGAPKKKCADCGKELPGSTVSDICAMCAIRRRNRELDQERERRDAQQGERDRYDISDEFDLSVFQQPGTHYYREEPSDPESDSGRRFGKKQSDGGPYVNPAQRRRKSGCLPALLILFVIVVAGIVLFLNASGERTAEAEVVSIPAEEALLPEDETDALTNSIGWDQAESEPAGVEASTLEELFNDYIVPTAESALSDMVYNYSDREPDGGVSFTHSLRDLTADQGLITDRGTLEYQQDGIPISEDYTFILMMGSDSYVTLYLEIGGEVFFDWRDEVTPDGFVTATGEEAYGIPEGDYLFGEPPLLLENYPLGE